MKSNLVSVIIPCYNGEKYLSQALKSVLWQTYNNWECILVDDGSTDKSAEIFKKYAQHDNRFRYIYQENKGLAASRNTGLVIARGDFIQFLDDDDILLPRRFHCCIEQFMQHSEADIVYSDYACFSLKDGFIRALPAKVPYTDAVRAFMFHLDISFVTLVHSFIFRRKVFDTIRFDANLHSYGEDIECWIRIALNGASFYYVDEVLSIYRSSEDALTQNEVKLFLSKLKTMERYRNNPKSIEYASEYSQAVQHFRECLTISYFMEKMFREGFKEFKLIWKTARLRSKIRLIGWIVLMRIFSKNAVKRFRTWLLLTIGLFKGKRAIHRRWVPPVEVDRLLHSNDR